MSWVDYYVEESVRQRQTEAERRAARSPYARTPVRRPRLRGSGRGPLRSLRAALRQARVPLPGSRVRGGHA